MKEISKAMIDKEKKKLEQEQNIDKFIIQKKNELI